MPGGVDGCVARVSSGASLSRPMDVWEEEIGQWEESVGVGLDRGWCAQRVGGGPGKELRCEAAQRSWGTSDGREGQNLPVLKIVLAAWWGRHRACAMGGVPQIHIL